MQGLKVFSPSGASKQALFLLQGRQETKLCDHPSAPLVHCFTVMQSSDQWFHTVFAVSEMSEHFLPPPWERSTVGAERQKVLKGTLLQVLVKPWVESTGPELQVPILLNTENLFLSVPCAARGDPQKDWVLGAKHPPTSGSQQPPVWLSLKVAFHSAKHHCMQCNDFHTSY